MDDTGKVKIRVKIGIIKNHHYSFRDKQNILEIETNWNLEKLQKYTVLTPLGSGVVNYKHQVVDYDFKEFRFGSFYNIENISNYIGKRREFDMDKYLNSNRFKNE